MAREQVASKFRSLYRLEEKLAVSLLMLIVNIGSSDTVIVAYLNFRELKACNLAEYATLKRFVRLHIEIVREKYIVRMLARLIRIAQPEVDIVLFTDEQ